MKILEKATKVFGLNDITWMRHSNKWSVWTRFFILPFFAVAIWSRIWISWYSLLFVAVLIFWTWINPRFFGESQRQQNTGLQGLFLVNVYGLTPKKFKYQGITREL